MPSLWNGAQCLIEGEPLPLVPWAYGPDYGYDANGNLTHDRDRNIAAIAYNAVDRPRSVRFAGGDVTRYVYSAAGERLAEVHASRDGLSDVRRMRLGAFSFIDGRLERTELPQGYLDTLGTLHAYIPDFQGNIVGVYREGGGLEQFTDYYPYGTPHPDARHPEANRRKYGAKELLTEGGLNEHDFEARRLTALASFSQPDPLASKYPWLSPYAYCAADPINLTDPTGLDWVATRNEDDTLNWSWNETIKSLEEAKEAGYVDYLPNGSLLDNASVNGGKIGSVCLGDGPSDVHYVEPNKTITPWELGVEWLTGEGPKTRRFKDGDNFTELVRKHEHYLNAIEDAKAKIRGGKMKGDANYSLEGVGGIPKYLKDYSTLLTAGTTGNLAATFLGSYGLSWVASVNGGIATITVTITNTSTMQSATRLPWLGYKGYWQNTIGKEINSLFETGPGSLKTQIIVLTEQFKL